MAVDEVASAIATAIEKERSHVRLETQHRDVDDRQRPRRFAELVQKGVPTAGESPLARFAAYSGRRTTLRRTLEPTELIDATDTDAVEAPAGDHTELVEEELLVEEISIDGMCGVY